MLGKLKDKQMKFLRKFFSKEWIWRLFLTLQIFGIILLICLELTTTWVLSDILDSKQYRRGQFGHIEENLMALGYLFFPFAITKAIDWILSAKEK
jgi:hypothetical protein